MDVMAAGMHHTLALRRKRQPGLFHDGQGIDVFPQSHRLAGLSSPQQSNAARLHPHVQYLDAALFQKVLDPSGGLELLIAQFRMGMDFPPRGDHIPYILFYQCICVHLLPLQAFS